SPTNVREGASTKSNVLTKIPRGTILSVQTFSKNWYSYTAMINGKRQTGYIHKKHVKKTITTNYNLTLDKAVQLQMTVARPKPQTDRYIGYVFKKYIDENHKVTAPALHYRTGPGTQYASLGTIPSGTQVKVLYQVGDWYAVEF